MRGPAGGGIFSSAARLIHATLVGNEARQGANIAVWEAPLAAFGSVIAMPAGGGQNCQLDVDGDAAGTGHNFADDASCNFTDATDTPSGGDPQLEALADNGGPTQTRLPAATSPLVDAIPEQDCDPASGTDQRGVERPQGSGCDIGAVEVEAVNAPPVAQDVSVLASQARPATVQLIATDPDGDDLSYTVAEQPEHGTLDGDGPRFSYTSEAGFSGTDTFTVKVCDPDDACDTAIVTVEVAAFQPPAEPPTDAGQLTVNPATAKAGDVVTVSGTGFEPGEAVFLVLYSEATSYGAVHVSADGKFSATITLRDNTEAGNHTLAAYGRKQSLAGALTITGNPGNGGVDDPGGDGNGGHGSGGSRVDNTPGTSGFSGSDDRKKGLALTGATVLPLVGGGLALLLAGTVGLLAARRTRHARTIEIGAP